MLRSSALDQARERRDCFRIRYKGPCDQEDDSVGHHRAFLRPESQQSLAREALFESEQKRRELVSVPIRPERQSALRPKLTWKRRAPFLRYKRPYQEHGRS